MSISQTPHYNMKTPTQAEISTNSHEVLAKHYPEWAATQGHTVYTAMWNLPGYLPEMEPFRTLSEESAREYLADEMDREANGTKSARRAQAFGEAAMAIRSGDVDYAQVDGYVYSVESGPCVDEEEERRIALATLEGEDLSDVESLEGYQTGAFRCNGAEYLVLTDSEADAECADAIERDLWAFRAGFLARYCPALVDEMCIAPVQERLCEDAQPMIRALVGDRLEMLVSDAVGADGRGPFLAGYDFEERESGRFFIYQTN